MASGLKRCRAVGYLAALLPLWGLCLVRLWAVLGGHIPGKLIGALSLLPAAGALFLCWRFELDQRLLRPFQSPAANLLAGGLSFLVGGLLDSSYTMISVPGALLDHPVCRGLCALGSGLFFACLVLAVCTAARAWGRLPTGSRWQLPILFLLVNGLTLFYILGSATVYVWDNAGYWTVARQLAAAPFGLDQLRQVVQTISTTEYNYLLALPISWVMRLFGGSRAVFVFATVNLYLLPTLWGLCALGRERSWGGVLLALLFPGLTYLALVGYVDVAACGVAVWAVVFYTRREAPGWSRGLLAGVCLAASFLLRRYFLFFAASFGVAALLPALRHRDREGWATFGSLFAATASVSLYCTQQFLVDKLTTNYGALYSAYDLGLRSDVMLFCRYFGFLVLGAALAWGLYRLIARRQDRDQMLLALAQLLLCFFLLTRIQSHGQQHTLLYVPCLALILAPFQEEFRWKRVSAWVLAAVCTLVGLLPRPQPASIAAIPYPDPVPGFSFHGPRREDIGQLIALSDRLDDLAARDGAGTTAAVCASSFLLNTDTLLNLRPSLNLPEREDGIHYIYVSSVDKRDGFSWAMLEADYLVVGDPVQVHLGEENQQIVAIPAHAVLDGTGFGAAYERLDDVFTLQDGSSVYLYRRLRTVTAAERQEIAQALTAKYPDYAQLYQAP